MPLSDAAQLRITSLATGEPNRAEARTLIGQWDDHYPQARLVEAGLIEQAITALVDGSRCRRARAAILAERARTAGLQFENTQEDRLLHCLRTINLDPYQGMAEFRRFAAGVRYIVTRWEAIDEAFTKDQCLYGNMMLECIQMRGCSARISELHFSEEAFLTWVYCHMAQPEPDYQEGQMLRSDGVMPVAIQRNPPQPWPPPREYCQQQLRQLIDRELSAVRALEATLRVEVEGPARAAAIELALARVSPDEIALLRAERHHERSYQAACRALLQVAATVTIPARRVVPEKRLIAQAVPAAPVQAGAPPAPPTVTNHARAADRGRPVPSRVARSSTYALGPRPHINEEPTSWNSGEHSSWLSHKPPRSGTPSSPSIPRSEPMPRT